MAMLSNGNGKYCLHFRTGPILSQFSEIGITAVSITRLDFHSAHSDSKTEAIYSSETSTIHCTLT